MIENKEELEAIEVELADAEISDEGIDNERAKISGEFVGAETCSALCNSLFNLMASRKGHVWKLTEEESQALGASLDAVLAKYIPTGIDKYGQEFALISVAVAIILPRIKRTQKAA